MRCRSLDRMCSARALFGRWTKGLLRPCAKQMHISSPYIIHKTHNEFWILWIVNLNMWVYSLPMMWFKPRCRSCPASASWKKRGLHFSKVAKDLERYLPVFCDTAGARRPRELLLTDVPLTATELDQCKVSVDRANSHALLPVEERNVKIRVIWRALPFPLTGLMCCVALEEKFSRMWSKSSFANLTK